MKSKILYIVISIVALLGIASVFGMKHIQSESSELVKLNTQYQKEWRAIDSNIESVNNITKLLSESYGNKVNDKSLNTEAIENTRKYNEELDKVEKYNLYKSNLEIVSKIKEEIKDNPDLSKNELISNSIKNLGKLSETINEQVKSYNKIINKHNSIVNNKLHSLFTKNVEKQKVLN